jgi:hypothetical protein
MPESPDNDMITAMSGEKAVRKILALVSVAMFGTASVSVADSSSWRCDFPGYNEPITYIADLGTGKGKAVGNVGTSDVWVLEGTAAISFIEPLFTGAVQVTTIVLKTGEAAHSRNSVFVLGNQLDFMPSQVRGRCRPWG